MIRSLFSTRSLAALAAVALTFICADMASAQEAAAAGRSLIDLTSAFSVGLYISERVKKALGRGMLARVVDAFLVAAGGMTLRTGVTVFAQLKLMSPFIATVIGDLALLAMAAGLFGAYLAIERYFKKMESRSKDARP
jgi:hypothetical protein